MASVRSRSLDQPLVPGVFNIHFNIIQVCMVFKEKLIKKYGYDVIFKDLIEDLRGLEVGMTINYPTERIVQMGLLAYSADNLEAHSLGKRKLIIMKTTKKYVIRWIFMLLLLKRHLSVLPLHAFRSSFTHP